MCAFLSSSKSPLERFFDGFTVWANRSVNVKTIQGWLRSAPLPTTRPDHARIWIPTKGDDRVGFELSRDSWPPSIAELNPDIAYLLPDRSGVVLAWSAGRTGWTRLLFIGEPGTTVPDVLRSDIVTWRSSEEGVQLQVGVRENH
jgi:hypothetical protein